MNFGARTPFGTFTIANKLYALAGLQLAFVIAIAIVSISSPSRTLIIVLLVVAIVVGVGVTWFVARGLTRSAGQLLDAAQGIAEGDVDQDIDVRSSDEIGQTARAFQDMIAYLKEFAGVAQRMAEGDLTVEVQPMSDRDLLGNSFGRLVSELERHRPQGVRFGRLGRVGVASDGQHRP